jgi:hypothetical protein
VDQLTRNGRTFVFLAFPDNRENNSEFSSFAPIWAIRDGNLRHNSSTLNPNSLGFRNQDFISPNRVSIRRNREFCGSYGFHSASTKRQCAARRPMRQPAWIPFVGIATARIDGPRTYESVAGAPHPRKNNRRLSGPLKTYY